MKKILITLFSILLSCSLCLTVSAEEKTIISNGHTAEGIYYTVYDIETIQNTQRIKGSTIDVVREIFYNGTIVPDKEISWRETQYGITYAGVLYLLTFTFSDGNTIATYEGTLTAIN